MKAEIAWILDQIIEPACFFIVWAEVVLVSCVALNRWLWREK